MSSGSVPTPPLALNSTVYDMGTHCAYSVISSVISTVSVDSISSPPDSAVYQPSNIYPVLDTVASVPYAKSYVTILVNGLGVPPSLASNVIVY
jgi:hypothetical protein